MFQRVISQFGSQDPSKISWWDEEADVLLAQSCWRKAVCGLLASPADLPRARVNVCIGKSLCSGSVFTNWSDQAQSRWVLDKTEAWRTCSQCKRQQLEVKKQDGAHSGGNSGSQVCLISDTLGELFQGLVLIQLVAFEVFFQEEKKIHKSSFSCLSAHVKSDYYCLSFYIPYCLVLSLITSTCMRSGYICSARQMIAQAACGEGMNIPLQAIF